MCGRATYKLTWEEIVALYRLTIEQPAVNPRARYYVCPTTTIDTTFDEDGKRRLERMRWGLNSVVVVKIYGAEMIAHHLRLGCSALSACCAILSQDSASEAKRPCPFG